MLKTNILKCIVFPEGANEVPDWKFGLTGLLLLQGMNTAEKAQQWTACYVGCVAGGAGKINMATWCNYSITAGRVIGLQSKRHTYTHSS